MTTPRHTPPNLPRTPLHARTYRRPGGAPLVRLVAEPLIEAEDLTLASVGVFRDTDSDDTGAGTGSDVVVGQTPLRAVGFPAWPVLTDPDNARHALNFVGDLEWARRVVRSRPKEVAKRFEKLAADLTASAPHFAPTLLEELTRLFAAHDEDVLARRMFSLAREVERSHGIAVDPDRHRAMFIEFAGLGAVGSREFTAEVKAAQERFGDPGQALDYVLALIAGLSDAGTPPNASMVRDTRRVAKAAGVAEAESDRKVLTAVLGTQGLPHAIAAFFTTLGPVTASFLTEHPDLADTFAGTLPRHLGIENFLAILDSCGWLDRHRADPTTYARWLVDLITAETSVPWSPHLAAEIHHCGETLAVFRGTSGGPQTPLVAQWPLMDPGILDALCAVGAVTDEAVEIRRTFLGSWARDPHGDLDALAAHPALGLRAMTELADRRITDVTGHLDILLAHSGTRMMLTSWLEYLAQRRRQRIGALPELGFDLEKVLPHLADPRLIEVAPDALRTLLTVDPAESFAAAVRAGLLVEYAWPALEDSVTRLERETGDTAQVFQTFPQVAVVAADRIEILDGDRVTGTLTAPTAGKVVRQVLTVGDSVFVLFRDGYDACLWWDGDAAATPTGSTASVGGAGTLPCAGGRLVGGTVLTGHGRIPEDRWATVIAVPGTGTFTVNDFGKSLQRWDPASGTGDGAVTVADSEEILETTGLTGLLAQILPGRTGPTDMWRKIRWENAYALPVPVTASPDNPLGAVDGTLIRIGGDASGTKVWNAHRQVTPLGCVDEYGTLIAGTAGEPWILHGDGRRTTAGGVLSFSSDSSGRRHVLERLPQLAWCVPGYRDRTASARMRAYTVDLAVEVVDALVPDPERRVPVPDHYDLTRETTTTVNSTPDAGAVTVLAGQLGIEIDDGADLTLAVALSHLAADCAALEVRADELRAQVFTEETGGSAPVTVVATDLTDEVVAWLSPWPLRATADMWTSATNDLLTWTRDGHSTGVTFEPYLRHGSVAHLCGRERMILRHWASPMLPRESVAPLIAFAREMVDAGLWCGPWVAMTVELTPELADQFPEQDLNWHDAGAPVLSLHGARFQPGHNDDRMTVLVRRPDLPQLTVPVITGPPEDALGMGREEFLAGLDALESDVNQATTHTLDEDAVARFHESTGLATPTARILVGGFHDPRYFDAAEKKRYGLTTKQMELAGDQIYGLGQETVEAVVAGIRSIPQPTVHLTDAEWDRAAALTAGDHRTGARELTELLYHAEAWHPTGATAALLALVAEIPLSDARRPALAELLRTMKTAAAEYMTVPYHRARLGEMDLGTSVEDKGFRGNVTPEDQTVRVAAEGLLDALIADLETVYPELPGCPLDPGNSVPQLVVDVASALGVTEPAARHYLQLLALADPTDAHIRSWNGWRKKDIDAAAAELTAGGLVVEAKRTGAGRTRFLPGGWLPGRSGITASRPMEVWTAQLYLIWADVKARPVIPGCPPHIPVRDLFTTAWQRITDGDVPGYGEISSMRHRV